MRFRKAIGAAAVAALSLLISPSVEAAQKVSIDRTEVDGHIYTVIRYDDDSVKVVLKAVMFGTPQFTLRDRMRRAVEQATHCSIKDDFLSDGKLIGLLSCSTSKQEGQHHE